MECMSLLGFVVCSPDPGFRARLPVAALDIDRSAIPAALRRRASQAIQMAFSAADHACRGALRSPSELPAVFASVGGEIQVTDRLCIELGKPDGIISPTAFHNSVHNTAAGYWSIAHRNPQACTAIAAGHETFAMALVESWRQLACHGGELLLVCYDEQWPEYLAAPIGSPPFACALVLGAGIADGRIAQIGRPAVGPEEKLSDPLAQWIANMPVCAAIPLLAAALGEEERDVPVSGSSAAWRVKVKPLAGGGS